MFQEIDVSDIGPGLHVPQPTIEWSDELKTPVLIAAEWLTINPDKPIPPDIADGLQRAAAILREPPFKGS